MNRRKVLWAALFAVPALVAGGLVSANSQKVRPYTCPLTGEELPCPKCCPLNDSPARAEAPAIEQAPMPQAKTQAGEYICPITGESLGCPNCCPLNKAKK